MSSIITTRNFNRAASLALAGFFSFSQAFAAGPSASSDNTAPVPDQALSPADQALSKDVCILENRFFFHQYRHDPMEKRLERLELMTLGAAQGGSNPERLARLKQSVVERDKEAARTIAREQKGDGELAAKTNYPVLGTLEWRMLKKTYPNESIDQRLARMESQLFGVPAQSMSYIDRIERLKKTVGMDVASAPPIGGPSRAKTRSPFALNGPLPRANRSFSMQPPIAGRGFTMQPPNTGNSSGYLYDADGNVTGWYRNNQQSWSFPGNSSAVPDQLDNQNVFEAMDQMNRQMNEMMRHFNSFGGIGGFGGMNGMNGLNGFGGIDPNDPNTKTFGIHIGPDGIHTFGNQAPKIMQNQGKAAPKEGQPAPPVKKFTTPKEELPSYTDPNSI